MADTNNITEQQQLNDALFTAINKGNTKGIYDAMEQGANLNAFDENGETPLTLVVKSGKMGTMKMLLENENFSADVNAENENGDSPLEIATEMQNQVAIDYLTEKGAEIVADKEKANEELNAVNAQLYTNQAPAPEQEEEKQGFWKRIWEAIKKPFKFLFGGGKKDENGEHEVHNTLSAYLKDTPQKTNQNQQEKERTQEKPAMTMDEKYTRMAEINGLTDKQSRQSAETQKNNGTLEKFDHVNTSEQQIVNQPGKEMA